MLRYLGRRLLVSVPVLIGLSILAFLIIHLVPGDPVRQMLGQHANPTTIAQVRAELGLDRPLVEQYFAFIGGAVHGDFGQSIVLNRPVTTLIGGRLEASALLIGYGLLVALVLGVPLAVLAAMRPDRPLDHAIRVMTTFSFAMPTFWLGLVLALVFGLWLRWLPVSGLPADPLGMLRSLTLPAVTLGLSLTAIVVRTLRSSLVQSLRSEYVEAARARGFSEARVVLRHALRPSVTALIAVLAVDIGFLIGGTVVLEAVFRIPGLGSLLVESVLRRDYTLVQALTLLAGTAVIGVSLVADLLQAALDPRVRLA